MKKITLALFLPIMLVSFSSMASSHGQKGQMNAKMATKNMAMKHANPMPNLMKVVKKFSHELNLNEEQAAKLKKWSVHNGPIMSTMIKNLMSAEKDLLATSLSAANEDEVQEKLDMVMSIRVSIAKGKMKCRTNMRHILDVNQWNTVVDIYKNKIM